ncbi:MAG: dockerin type I domain-containing protein [Candidatus Poribacteria bacterium]|nr:dockerin type I domain-containing protein [Candidatus Poribacteria bacterium]
MKIVFSVIIGGFLLLSVVFAEKPSVRDRIANRSYPSIFMAWHGIFNPPERKTFRETNQYHDLMWSPESLLHLERQPDETFVITGDLEFSETEFQAYRQNPNIVILLAVPFIEASSPDAVFFNEFYDDDFPWLLDASGDHVYLDHPQIDFTDPRFLALFRALAVAVDQSEFYDGIFIDYWDEGGVTLKGLRTLEAEVAARVEILSSVRATVSADFLILVNGNMRSASRAAPYINGVLLETYRVDMLDDYEYLSMQWFEANLRWASENLRHPQITCFEVEGIGLQYPFSDENLQDMRAMLTLSLTHSDAYFLYTMGVNSEEEQAHRHDDLYYNPYNADHANAHAQGLFHLHHHAHYWYDFWDADLGRPIGAKAETYENIAGLFIREFDHGFAVYNRSGKPQHIQFPENVSGFASGIKNNRSHTIPDLDGEIYLKTINPADLNGDGTVNILDLVIVANALGKDTPDLNGDGTVNILDLIIIAKEISQ